MSSGISETELSAVSSTASHYILCSMTKKKSPDTMYYIKNADSQWNFPYRHLRSTPTMNKIPKHKNIWTNCEDQ